MKGRWILLLLTVAVGLRFAETRSPLPAYGAAFYRLGEDRQRRGDLDGAADRYQKALHYRPDLAMAHEALAWIAVERGDRTSAVRQFQAAVQVDPQFYSSYTALGWIYLQDGEKDKAVAAFNQANQLRNCCRPGIYRYDLGLAHLLKGDKQEACALTRDAKEFGSQDLGEHLDWIAGCQAPPALSQP